MIDATTNSVKLRLAGRRLYAVCCQSLLACIDRWYGDLHEFARPEKRPRFVLTHPDFNLGLRGHVPRLGEMLFAYSTYQQPLGQRRTMAITWCFVLTFRLPGKYST